MAGGQVDSLVVLATGALLALGLVLVFRATPRLAVLAWIATVAFVPVWMGVGLGVYVPPATAMAAVALTALASRGRPSLRAPDLVLAAVVVLALAARLLGDISVHALFVVLTEWTLAYALARVACALVPVEWVYRAVAVVLALAGALAVVEFVTGVNVFVQYLSRSNGMFASWGSLQERGGIVRAEGAFGHSIALGASLALAVPLALGSRLRPGPKVTAVALLVAGAVVSFSRIGIGASVIGLLLALVVLGRELRPRLRLVLAAALVGAGFVALPVVERVFRAAGQEAEGSADYRSALLELVPTVRLIGTSFAAQRDAAGVLRFGGYRSIDSAVIYAAVTYGWIIVALLVVLYVVAVAGLLRPGLATPPAVALAAHVPALVSVAFITQYSSFFWFVAGLAVSAYSVRVVRPGQDGRQVADQPVEPRLDGPHRVRVPGDRRTRTHAAAVRRTSDTA